jgi:hypothetical protein
MHQLAYIAVVMTILGGGDKPETQLVPQGIWEQAECLAWQKDMESTKPTAVNAAGRPVIAKQYICQLVSVNDLQGFIDKIKKPQ